MHAEIHSRYSVRSGVLEIDLLHFLAECHKMLLNQGLKFCVCPSLFVCVSLVICVTFYPAIRSMDGILTLLCLFLLFMYGYGFLSQGFLPIGMK